MLVRQVRKRRSAAEKRLIVEQALEPGASVARVARAHGLNANVVFNWRRLYKEGKLTAEATQGMKLLPVSVEEREAAEPLRQGKSLRVADRSTLNFRARYGSAWKATLIQRRFVRCLRSFDGDRPSGEGAGCRHADMDRGWCDGHASPLPGPCGSGCRPLLSSILMQATSSSFAGVAATW